MKASLLILVIVSAGWLTGCIHTEKTTYQEEPRVSVEFETDTAARIFYEAFTRQPASKGRTESNTEVNLPVVFGHKERVVQGESVAFNAAVRRCDTNTDGRITEQEARIYADFVRTHR